MGWQALSTRPYGVGTPYATPLCTIDATNLVHRRYQWRPSLKALSLQAHRSRPADTDDRPTSHVEALDDGIQAAFAVLAVAFSAGLRSCLASRPWHQLHYRTASQPLSLPYSWRLLLQRPQAPHLLTFARSRVLTVQASTPPARSVAKANSYGTWRPFTRYSLFRLALLAHQITSISVAYLKKKETSLASDSDRIVAAI